MVLPRQPIKQTTVTVFLRLKLNLSMSEQQNASTSEMAEESPAMMSTRKKSRPKIVCPAGSWLIASG